MKTTLRTILILEFLLSSFIFSQQSGPQYYRTGVMDGNNIKTVFGNWGVIGQPSTNSARGSWKYPSNGYFGEESFFVGVEFPIKDYTNDGRNDTVHSVITCPVQRPTLNRDMDPSLNVYWTFMPVDTSGKLNSQTVAMSNDNSTWPASWNGVWKGIDGKNKASGDLEAYYQVNDKNDVRYSFAANNPYGANFTGGSGQGISVEVRYIQIDQPLFRDVLIRVYDIKNENTITYDKIFFGNLMGTYIGVSGPASDRYQEYDDDYSIFYKKENVVISGDFSNNNSRNPLWKGRVGKMGSAFLLAPNNNAIASYNYFTNSSEQIDLRDDENLWKRFTPGTNKYPSSIVNDTTVLAGEDGDYTIGTGYFSLNPGETKRIVSVLAYGYTKDEISQAVNFSRIFVNAGFDVQKMDSAISIQSVSQLPGSKTINWQTTQPGGTIDVYFSSDNGVTFSRIAENEGNDGSFNWNTSAVADCYFGRLMVVAKDGSGNQNGFRISERFSIDNAMNGLPFLSLLSDTFATTALIDKPILSVPFLIGDADNPTLTLKTFYSTGGAFTLFATQPVQTSALPNDIQVNLTNAPNSNTLSLKFELSDGINTVSTTTNPFKKQIARTLLSESNVQFISKNTTASVQINVRDAGATTNDTYQISFCDTVEHGKKKTYSVKNITKGTMMAENLPLVSGTETDLFGGLSLTVNDVTTGLDKYSWSNTSKVKNPIIIVAADIFLDMTLENILYAFPHPRDLKIIFYDHVVDTSLNYYGSTPIPVKFKTFNTTTSEKIKSIADIEGGLFNLLLFEQVLGKEQYTWYVTIEPKNDSLPQPGDTVSISLRKGISFYDSLLVKNIALSVGGDPEFIPGEYSLSQNYPNPFNPSTVISYQLPVNSHVTLKVYDVLGREAAVLVNEVRNAGTYSTAFDASKLSSGVYFYSLTAGSFSSTKKMMLIK